MSGTAHKWGLCSCGCQPGDHDAVIIRPVVIDPGNRVLFEGTLGRCNGCGACRMYDSARLRAMAAGEGARP